MLLVSRPAPTEDDNVQVGILWMLATTLFFVSLDATAKYLLVRYPLIDVVWARLKRVGSQDPAVNPPPRAVREASRAP